MSVWRHLKPQFGCRRHFRARCYILARLCLIATVVLAAYCLLLLAVVFFWPLVWVGVFAVVFGLRRRRTPAGQFGDASWAQPAEIEAAGCFGGDGLGVGVVEDRPRASLARLFDPRCDSEEAVLVALSPRPRRRMFRINICPHVSIYAPTGTGKGQSVLIPYLLDTEF